MRYVIKQKMFSFGDDFVIKDEQGEERFYVDGKLFSIGNQLTFRDMAGRELAFIRQTILSWGPTYEIHRDGAMVAVVKKDLFTFFNCHFCIDVPGPNDLEAFGGFTDHEYRFSRGSVEVAHVSKSWFALTDTYGVDIIPGQDDILILAGTVVIDMACHPDNTSNSSCSNEADDANKSGGGDCANSNDNTDSIDEKD